MFIEVLHRAYGYGLLGLLALFFLRAYRHRDHRKLPYGILSVTEAWMYLLRGRSIIERGAQKLGAVADNFSRTIRASQCLPAPGTRMHVVSSVNHWKEISNAHCGKLSAHAVSKEMFRPQYSMGGIEWSEYRDEDGMPATRGVRTVTHQLPHLTPKFAAAFDAQFSSTLKELPHDSKFTNNGYWPQMMRARICLSTHHANLTTLYDHREYKPVIRAIFRLESVRRSLFAHVGDLVAERKKKNRFQDPSLKPNSVLESIVDVCPRYFSDERMVVDVIMSWITTNALAVTGALLLVDLCNYTEHVPALCQELVDLYKDPVADLDKLRFLESFIMESSRTNAFMGVMAQRIAIEDFTFSGGYTIPEGQWVQLNQQRWLQDPNTYPRPEHFDPYRKLYQARRFTDVSPEWPIWGVPKLACPGKHHVLVVMKLLLIHVVSNYEVDSVAGKSGKVDWWEARLPNSKARLMMRKRVCQRGVSYVIRRLQLFTDGFHGHNQTQPCRDDVQSRFIANTYRQDRWYPGTVENFNFLRYT
ncbi:cytochrome P450 [Lophiotrema nucula]|uniref:Cytochrome P450 n=1 Tax=Lophiotrema nucula TaxID=690887 RepID=A0A6A5YZF5_9PLEO|nr:cytochrome P450 [Lophiotrema nucula]